MNTDDIDLIIKNCYENVSIHLDYMKEIRMEREKEEEEATVLLSDICGMLDKGIVIQQ